MLGSATAMLVEGFKRLGTHIEDFGRGIIGWYAKITGATDAQGGLNVANMRLYNTGTSVMATGEKWWEDKDSPDRYYTAAELSDAITNVEANHVRLQRISNDDDFDDEVRNDARAGAAEVAELLTQLKTSYENAVAREAEAARVREGEEVRTAFNRANAHTESEILQANGYEALYELEEAIEEIYNRIQEGNGTRFDSAEYERLKKIEEEIYIWESSADR